MPRINVDKNSSLYQVASTYHGVMDEVDTRIRQLCLVFLSLLVCVVMLNVVMRYVFSESLLWANEVSRYLMIWFALLITASLVNTDDHLHVGLFYDRFSPSTRYGIQIAIAALYTVLGLIWVFFGAQYAFDAGFRSTMPALGFQMVWVYSVVPISGALVALFSLSRVLRLAILERESNAMIYEASDRREVSDD
ncbi:TRAP transporter small permease [Halopenitus salinus]|uniref:TRAP transporter small permease n=1 Tax=Halopenitus salinus TaxID=1198295 RepID=A0ABD5V075_9EURY